jgi:hypothetical protein
MVLVILVGVVFAGIGGYLVYRKRRLAKVGQRCPGTVVDMREHISRDTHGVETRTWNPVLAFKTPDGQDIQTEVTRGGFAADQVGAQVGVIYDPENPRNAEIDTPAGRSAASGYVTMAVGLLIIIFGIVVVH